MQAPHQAPRKSAAKSTSARANTAVRASTVARATAPPAKIPGEKIAAIFDDDAAPSSILKPAATPSKPRGGLMRATTPHPNVLGFVLASYRLEGWEVVKAPPTAPMDLICVRATRFHFVKVLGGAEPSDGERNQFIQNALSNTAEPIFGTVEGEKMELKNINEGTRVNIKAKLGQK